MSPTVSIMQVGNTKKVNLHWDEKKVAKRIISHKWSMTYWFLYQKRFFVFLLFPPVILHNNNSDSRNWSNWMTSTVKKLFYINAGYWLGSSTHRFLGYTPQKKIFAKYCGFNIRSLPSPMVHTSKDPSALETRGSVGDVMYSHRRPHFFFLPGKITVAVTLAMYFFSVNDWRWYLSDKQLRHKSSQITQQQSLATVQHYSTEWVAFLFDICLTSSYFS